MTVRDEYDIARFLAVHVGPVDATDLSDQSVQSCGKGIGTSNLHFSDVLITLPLIQAAVLSVLAPRMDLMCLETFIRSVKPFSQLIGRGHIDVAQRILYSAFSEEKVECLLCPLARAYENMRELGWIDQVASANNYLRSTHDLSTPVCCEVQFCGTGISPILTPLGLTF
ncbi:MAG: hypothetical protein Q9224_000318 [Gallowayella concinna]